MKTSFKISLIASSIAVMLSACSSTDLNKTEKQTAAVDTVWPTDTVAFCDAALDKAATQYGYFSTDYPDPTNIPRSYTNGSTRMAGKLDWTSGFVAGSYWYLYEHTQSDQWLNLASKWTKALEDQQFNRRTHDIGFIMNNSFGNGLRLTGDQSYSPVILNSAKTLMERYNPDLGLTYSWSWGAWEFPVIIDNMMNLELLFEAAKASGDKRFYDAAVSHATVTMKHHYREDYSSYHLVNYNRTTGIPNWKQTFQGIADDSSWARGQAWGAYGYTMVYRYTQDEKFLNQAKNIVNYLLTHKNMPDDLVPYFDYNAPEYPEVDNVRDSSAASLLASSLLELATYVGDQEAQRYIDAATTMLRSLSTPSYLATKGENGNFLLKQATGHYPAGDEVNGALNYGDYYYLEALNRCKATL
ncbi:glycoside hydrolase family 88 protein [Echinimonas agarilytica]|uniref:Glycoside hydrolase family 88 protein n=1 Tax=Echinimonas agarilytica TaxID=1215918 RepID=A0AA42B8Y6_9GAMM|nr:glycoside hydrolase family 88 protein [Echinimonas agarilytica]MCM2680711.1 glycoside hydrolase family 88 protein [Echinimonas agarilytica]